MGGALASPQEAQGVYLAFGLSPADGAAGAAAAGGDPIAGFVAALMARAEREKKKKEGEGAGGAQ